MLRTVWPNALRNPLLVDRIGFPFQRLARVPLLLQTLNSSVRRTFLQIPQVHRKQRTTSLGGFLHGLVRPMNVSLGPLPCISMISLLPWELLLSITISPSSPVLACGMFLIQRGIRSSLMRDGVLIWRGSMSSHRDGAAYSIPTDVLLEVLLY